MNKYLVIIFLILKVLPASELRGQNISLSLQINKHYFSVDEKVCFSIFSPSGKTQNKDLPLYVALMKVNKDHQKLISIIEVLLKKGHASGSIRIPEHIRSGTYLIGVFHHHRINDNAPVDYRLIYLYNPLGDQYPDTLLPEITRKEILQTSKKWHIQYDIEKDAAAKNRVKFNAAISDADGNPVLSQLSISIVSKEFYETAQASLINPQLTEDMPEDKKTDENLPENILDSLILESRYIRGKLLINGVPAGVKKVYLYAHNNDDLALDKYITDRKGRFYFPKPSFTGLYPLKLLTFPEPESNYSFELAEHFHTDSIYHIDVPDYPFAQIQPFRDLAYKNYLIEKSFNNDNRSISTDTVSSLLLNVKASHEIILDKYVHFNTLAEIIREIVPQVSIRYKQGQYEIRVFDARARNYCCQEDPLIFINHEPYFDLEQIMSLNTENIYSVAVIRPVEAIQRFGDIGVNGILKINLNAGIDLPDFNSRGKADFIIPGPQSENSTCSKSLPDGYPDFRSFLFWDGNIVTDKNGGFQCVFRPSLLQSDYKIIIHGLTGKGEILHFEIPVTEKW